MRCSGTSNTRSVPAANWPASVSYLLPMSFCGTLAHAAPVYYDYYYCYYIIVKLHNVCYICPSFRPNFAPSQYLSQYTWQTSTRGMCSKHFASLVATLMMPLPFWSGHLSVLSPHLVNFLFLFFIFWVILPVRLQLSVCSQGSSSTLARSSKRLTSCGLHMEYRYLVLLALLCTI